MRAREKRSGRVVVIGAGFGGLAAALRARAMGYDVQVIERLDQPGGRARVFRRDGFTFDAGPTVITAPDLFDELWHLFGEKRAEHVAFLPVRPWYRIGFADGRAFDYGGTVEEMRARVSAFAPGDAEGFVRLAERTRALYRAGYLRMGAMPFHRFSTMMRAVPTLVRLGAWRSLYRFVARDIADESLRRVFTLQMLLVGGHPFRSPALYALIQQLEREGAVWFARGGMTALVQQLVRLGERHGVRMRCGATVSRILVERGRTRGVVLESGETIPAEIVIANADAPMVHEALMPPGRRRSKRRLDRLQPSMGLFVLYFGTTRVFPAIAHHTILLGQSYRALLDRIFGTDPTLPDDLSLYLHRPTATDPSLAPPGQDAFYVLAPVPNLRAPIDWDRARQMLRDRIVRILSERIMPGLEACIVSESSLTPLDFRHDYLSRDGAGFSIAPILRQSAFFRFHNRVRGVRNLYLVGAGTHPGAGVPGVLCSAKLVETLMRTAA
ncbi:phytoene desaturase family protein [Acetobacteraceae bacterium KSS8]|uniref:Phytoene dehydrogenase n=1 Tax=Endosaccharibacter trunci TaxID=2812733 RepID=A0ABT1W522_9PROT|nr:phytoene desaturase family protein [Acetobacteraceae bacterium KSS8]